ncbi:ADP-ribosylglycohydrolase family protein [Nonomuraea dietziae]|uniref:ADP-ribosylglycohydrolase family protein n=1 Tax=Nonomuraea dietziae TaxID=65515 RepID=UPI00342093E2
MRAAIDLAGDTDTVAVVTGGLAGAVYGPAAIPANWTKPLHVPLPESGGRTLHLPHLIDLASDLVRRPTSG